MGLGMEKDFLPILAVALITWGGVLAYMVRLDFSARELARRLEVLENEQAAGGEQSTGTA